MELGPDSVGGVVQPYNNSLTGLKEEPDGDSEEADDSCG